MKPSFLVPDGVAWRSVTRRFSLLGFAAVAGILSTPAWSAPPRIGYVYPAGGQVSTTFEAEIGGQYLGDPHDVIVSGGGVTVEILDHNKLPSAQIVSDYRDRLRDIMPDIRTLAKGGDVPVGELLPKIHDELYEADLSEKKLRQADQYTRQRADPKRQLNSQIGETVTVRITIAGDADPGLRYCRLLTATGLSNPLRFIVGRFPEIREPKPYTFSLLRYLGMERERPTSSARVMKEAPTTLPVTFNGQILPGEVDEFVFQAKEGDQVVVALQARNLIPYLADAVPGWFQSVISLRDTRGNELAFADDYRFDPDPVLFYKIPRTGEYRVRVNDSIYRGREDFVYRITVGELPFLTGITPLGGRAGSEVDLVFQGGNLTEHHRKRFPLPETSGIIGLTAAGATGLSNSISFHVEDLPEDTEREGNDRIGAANEIDVSGIVNGTINRPGDADFYRLKGTGNQPITFEIFARRLGSPVDANLTVFDDDGKQIAWNDDFDNPSAGLTTHHADARITVDLPSNGLCFVRVADTQNRGGYANAYRLKVTQGLPAVALRATPSSVNAKPGGSAQLTVHALRLDGYAGAVHLELKDAPPGFVLKNATIPAGEDSAKISIAVPNHETEAPMPIILQGSAEVEGKDPVIFDVVPAEDMTQAFITRHFVPVDELLIDVRTPPEKPAP